MILKRVGEQRRAHLSELELQTKYLVRAIWAASGHAKRGQPRQAADEVQFLPKRAKRREPPPVAQVLRMFPPDAHTLVQG